MIKLFSIALTLSLLTSLMSGASSGSAAADSNNRKQETHSQEDGHNHDDGEEKAENVGAEKGITEFNERFGFKLSAEALKNFDLRFQRLKGDGPWQIPKSAIVHSGEERNVFRKRNDFFKRIDFQTIKNSENQLTVDSDDLREGDEVVLVGLGFLRIAELAATGGVAHGHSH